MATLALSGRAELWKFRPDERCRNSPLTCMHKECRTHACQEAQRGQQSCLKTPFCCVITIMPREHAAAAAVLCYLHARLASNMDERHNDCPGEPLCKRLH